MVPRRTPPIAGPGMGHTTAVLARTARAAASVLLIGGLIGSAVPSASSAMTSTGTDRATAQVSAETEETPAPEPIERTECPVEIPDEHADRVECGVLIVPVRRGDDADPEQTLRLPYAVIASTSSSPQPDPLVFPTLGGPGAGSLSALGYFLGDGADWAVGERNVILLEQRGDQFAEPTLNCPELDTGSFIVDGALLTGSASEDAYLAGVQACHDRLVADGVDIAAFTSRSTVGDLQDLRAALGYDEWNMYGVSYGARVALTVMRDQPEGLRSVILDSPYPPNIDRYERIPGDFVAAVDRLLITCAQDEACAEAYPDLATTLADLLEEVASEPLEVTVDSPVDGAPVRVALDDAALADGLFRALYSASDVRVLPFVIDQLGRGNVDAAIPLAQRGIDGRDYFAEGLYLSIECAEEVPFNDPEVVAEAYAASPLTAPLASGSDEFAQCALWQTTTLGDRENAVVESEVPALITTGGFDPITPRSYGEAAAAGLPNATVAFFPRMAHGAVWENGVDDCAAGIARQFLADPVGDLETSCVASSPPVEYLTTADVDPTSAIYRFDRDVLRQREPWQLALGLTTVGLLIATLVYGVVVALRRRLRLSGDIPVGAVPAAVMSATFNLAYAAGLAAVILAADPLVLGFGLPPWIWPLLLLPFAGLVMAILLIVLLVRAWMQDDGTLLHRILLSVSAAASVVFFLWVLGRGLLPL